VLLAALASLIRVPYYSLAPGSAISLTDLVAVESGKTYPPKGEVFLTTVSLKRSTVLEAVRGWLDPSIAVRPKDEILPPDVSSEELRKFNLELMADSKQTATTVVFELLGYDVRSGNGAEIVAVVDGSPADGTLKEGEVIVAVDGRPASLSDEAVTLIGEHQPGDLVNLEIAPADGGPHRAVELSLARHEDDPARPFVGVQLQTKDFDLHFPFQVDIESQRIGGPSAGLAFTLSVLDVLTEGELTGGQTVAVTGSIAFDGRVGPVGGVAQKAVAVRRAGIDVFLVPSHEYDLAKRYAGDGVQVEKVDTVQDALRILTDLGGDEVALPAVDHGAERT